MKDRLMEDKYNDPIRVPLTTGILKEYGEPPRYKGRDGKDYYSLTGLKAADEQWRQTYQPFIG